MAIEATTENGPDKRNSQIITSDFEELRKYRAWGVPEIFLTSADLFEDNFIKFTQLIGANIIGDPKIVRFDGEFTGFTGVAVIGESTVSGHTYLEKGQSLDLTVESCTKLPYLEIAASIIYDLFGQPQKIQEIKYITPDPDKMERELEFPFAFRDAGLSLTRSNLYVNGRLVNQKILDES